MREGTNWVATDWWQGQSQCFQFSTAQIPNTRQVKVSWFISTSNNDSGKSPTYYLAYGDQSLNVNNVDTGYKCTRQASSNFRFYKDTAGRDIYYGYADAASWIDNHYNKKVYYDVNGDYVGYHWYLLVQGTKWRTGTFTCTADDAGYIQFFVSGRFGWYGKTGLNFDKTFKVKAADVATYTITYNKNDSNLRSGNSISLFPSTEKKLYNQNIILNRTAPAISDVNKEVNYNFLGWSTKASNSFTGTIDYKPGSTYSVNGNASLYAIWQKADKTITLDIAGGSTSLDLIINTKYDTTVTLPNVSDVKKYGYVLSGWQTKQGIYEPGSSYTCIGNETIIAIYNSIAESITLVDKNGNTLRSFNNDYGKVLTGDFTYTESGYECVGWNTKQLTILNPNSDLPPIIPNEPFNTYEGYKENHIYIGANNYTTNNPYVLPNNENRLHMIGQSITLYPVLQYKTTMYVYNSGTWKPALPYINVNTVWKQTLGQMYITDSWKK